MTSWKWAIFALQWPCYPALKRGWSYLLCGVKSAVSCKSASSELLFGATSALCLCFIFLCWPYDLAASGGLQLGRVEGCVELGGLQLGRVEGWVELTRPGVAGCHLLRDCFNGQCWADTNGPVGMNCCPLCCWDSHFLPSEVLLPSCHQKLHVPYWTPNVAGLWCMYIIVGEWGWGVEGKQVGSMDEESQVRGCYNITFICTPTNQETVSVLEKTQANKTFRTWKQM